MEKIYRGTFACDLCSEPQEFRVFGMDDSADLRMRTEAEDWARHWHWCAVHRLCARCGRLVLSGDLEMAVNDGRIKIHDCYTDEYRKVLDGETGRLLIVHKECSQGLSPPWLQTVR